MLKLLEWKLEEFVVFSSKIHSIYLLVLIFCHLNFNTIPFRLGIFCKNEEHGMKAFYVARNVEFNHYLLLFEIKFD
ncbi:MULTISPECIES: hypothetical protein [Bacillus cereus group]|uniref:Uncharacterized protein n=1 Tax=Bacillus cereus TaxID=1396 RepID=A0A9W7QJR9_BACCE|nr:hypothetical protein [Bacillus cereus]KAB2399844.1 hypothetical protein F8172_01985 [Bacillus cereus]KAB2410616.1 hypothetical protein F8170_01285 [Bacillus cereus]KAB2431850.1 hypothetical protein F8168_02930 [Bacillus cereus]